MRNAWERQYRRQMGDSMPILDVHQSNSMSLKLLEHFLAAISLRRFRSSKFRIPEFKHEKCSSSEYRYILQYSLAQALIRSIIAVAHKQDHINFEIKRMCENESITIYASISNPGQLLKTAFKLYDQQYCVIISMEQGFESTNRDNTDLETHDEFNLALLIRCLVVRAQSKFRAGTRRLFGRAITWKAAVIPNGDINKGLEDWTQLTDTFAADPFVFDYENASYLFTEGMSKNKGDIEVRKIEYGEISKTEKVLIEDFHLSFPYVFVNQDEIYMCPETSSINEVRLYKAAAFPRKWVHTQTILKDIRAVDPIIIELDNAYFLLTNLSVGLVDTFDSTLWAFRSNRLDSGEWTALRNNPVVVSAQKSRNGGYFKEGNLHFRVNQFSNYGEYGSGIGINRIIFRDDKYSEIEVDAPSYNLGVAHKGCHHMSKSKLITAIDFSQEVKTKK